MALVVLSLAAALCALAIVALRPLLVRYALARPNARSSHRIPTPQGGGIAVVGVTLLVATGALAWGGSGEWKELGFAAAAAVLLAIVGAVDDMRPLPPGPRLLAHVAAVGAVVAATEIAIVPSVLPGWLEVALLVLAGVWFVNLVNFMDGLDWITAAEMVPLTAFVAGAGLFGLLPVEVAVTALALCGALLGFAPFNKPVARLFLGDVGSLPIGLLVGWLLLHLAEIGALAAALLLPLYHLVDATTTLLRRLARGERVWEAHRDHFYQQATANGLTSLQVSARVFGLNLLLAGLAALTLLWPRPEVQVAALCVGLVLVGVTHHRFSRRTTA